MTPLAACMTERDQLAETCRTLRLDVEGKEKRIAELERAAKAERTQANEWLVAWQDATKIATAMRDERDAYARDLTALRAKAQAFADVVADARPFHGDFCAATPSVMARLAWWAKELTS